LLLWWRLSRRGGSVDELHALGVGLFGRTLLLLLESRLRCHLLLLLLLQCLLLLRRQLRLSSSSTTTTTTARHHLCIFASLEGRGGRRRVRLLAPLLRIRHIVHIVQCHAHHRFMMSSILNDRLLLFNVPQTSHVVAGGSHKVIRRRAEHAIPDPTIVTLQRFRQTIVHGIPDTHGLIGRASRQELHIGAVQTLQHIRVVRLPIGRLFKVIGTLGGHFPNETLTLVCNHTAARTIASHCQRTNRRIVIHALQNDTKFRKLGLGWTFASGELEKRGANDTSRGETGSLPPIHASRGEGTENAPCRVFSW